MRGLFKRIATFVGAFMLASFPSLALSETADELPGLRTSYDENNVDVVGAYARFNGPSISIGQPGAGGLSFQRNYIEVKADYTGRWSHTYDIEAYLDTPTTDNVTVVLNGALDAFDVSSVVTDSPSLVFSGAFLTLGTSTSTYTAKTGDRYTFTMTGGKGELASIQYANGETRTFTYSSTNRRLLSVNNNFGYQIKFEYYSNVSTDPGYYEIYKATAINNAVDYCDPTATSCSGFTQSWPSLTFSNSGALGYNSTLTHTVTDDLGRAAVVTIEKFRITSVQNPAGPTITYSRDRSGDGRPKKVTAVTRGSDTWTYTDLGNVYYTDPYTSETTERWRYSVTSPTNVTVGYESDVNQLWITRRTEPDGSYAFYNYDAGLLSSILAPTGQITAFEYDARGNLLSTTIYSSPYDSSLPTADPITTSATYEASCTSTNFLYCNKPVTTTDAGGAVTNYYYDELAEGHGQLTRITLPSPDGVAARPEVRTTYESRQAYYKTGSSTWSSGSAVWLPKTVKTCATGAGNSCANAANEVVAETSYGSTSGANNLLPVSISKRAGNASSSGTATTSMTYNVVGQVTSVDGPLTTADGLASSSDDTTFYRYDAYWRLVGVVAPDPDGGGSLKPGAQRTVYDGTTGNVSRVEVGTVNAAADSPWDTNFTVLSKVEAAYDSRNRPVTQTLKSGAGTILGVDQVSYNGASQVICKTSRLNSADFSSPPSACTQGTGSKDQIVQNGYDAYGRLTTVTSGVGTSFSQATQTITYYAPNPYGLVAKSGKIESVTDANGNKTTYLYDRFSRNWRIFYPSKTTAGSSSSTDYEEFTFDASSNLADLRLRDATTVSSLYDKLNRLTTAMDGTTFTYDNLNRKLSVTGTVSGQTATIYNYDAFDNILSETTTLGAMAYQYDLGGRRTRMAWPDSVFVTYVWDAASNLKDIRLSGSTSLAAFDYDSYGRRTALTRGNGASTSYSYDDRSLLSGFGLDLASTGSDQTVTFIRDAAGRITDRSGTNSAYDVAAPSTTTISYTPNGLNQITTGGGVSWSHDDRGNATAVGANSFTYDIANRMTGLTGAVSLVYDPSGRLYEHTGASTMRLQYDGADLVTEYNTSGTVQRRYVHGPSSDEPLVWFEGSNTSTARYLMADERGSIIAVTDATGAVLATNTYDEYGNPSTTSPTYAGLFRYTGQAWLSDLGLYYYKARMYAPDFGRFMQTDPVGYGDGMNMYAYVGSDPINATDPTGLCEADLTNTPIDNTGTTVADVMVCAKRRRHDLPGWEEAVRQALEDAGNSFSRWWNADDVGPNGTCMAFSAYGGSVDRCTALNQGIQANGRQSAVGYGAIVVTGVTAGVGIEVLAGEGAVATCNCFEAGTMVATDNGLRPIESVEVGERVLARDEITGETAFKPVQALIHGAVRPIYNVTLLSVNDEGQPVRETIGTTDEHPWNAVSGAWIQTKNLLPGQLLHTAGASAAEVLSVDRTERREPTFNFEVADFHTYFVGQSGAWVHNSCNILSQVMQHLAKQGWKAGKISDVLGWGTKEAGAVARLGEINAGTVAEMQSQGLTQGMVRALRSGYVDAIARGTGIGTAEARVQVLDAILAAW